MMLQFLKMLAVVAGGSYFVGENSKAIAGNQNMPTHDGTSTMIGNSGNGYAKITLVGK